MRIFKTEVGTIYIVAGKGEEVPRVVIAKDGGKEARNMFGKKLERFAYHWASVFGNTSYTSRTNCLIDEEDNVYQYKLVKVKKIKSLGSNK